ncbi:MAG: ShlB/FhaC/HecB family hemolysin secretion/activation protein [Rhodoferax sp.]|nr:ShlB/FhaC/HecB family hemolysin secretion/activation protein [Rhodoferax sp.]
MRSTSTSAKALIGSILAATHLLGHAQRPPDAGAILQEIERNRKPALPAKPSDSKPGESPVLSGLPGDRVTVNRFNFVGNTLIGSEQLASVVAPWLGRAIGFAELREAADAVARHYRDAGWLVRVVLPRQDVTAGQVTLQVVEAVFGGALREGDGPLRLNMSLVMAHFESRLAKGEAVPTEALERALLLADDLPGVKVAGSLRAAAKEGETELVLKLDDEPLWAGDVSGNNSGARSTGSNQLAATLSLASPLGQGELFNASAMAAQGVKYLRLGGSTPLGADGWRAGVSVGAMRYSLVTSEFAGQGGSGSSGTYGLEASYPLVRSRARNLSLQLALDYKQFDNQLLDRVQSDYSVRSWSAGLSADMTDTWGGGGMNRASVSLTQGQVDLGALQAGENPDSSGGFKKVRYSLSRQQRLTQDMGFLVQLTGQHSDDQLDSSERFGLGGASGVRAYPSSEGSGPSGQMIKLELNRQFPFGLVLTGFYDWGQVRNWDSAISYSLKGYGLSLDWHAPTKLSVKVTLARRVGDNPNPTSTGADQDGTLDLNRLWVTASLPF